MATAFGSQWENRPVTRYRSTFTTPEQAVAEALFPALLAPDDDKTQAATMLAEQLAAWPGNRS